MNNIVLSIDVGYGNVKACWGLENSPNTEIIFRSIANPVMKDTIVNTTKGRVPVCVDGVTYMVGPDAYLYEGNGISDANFTARKEYRAFLIGAMHFMFRKTGVYHRIGILTVGLPIGSFTSHQDMLHEVCKGEHIVPTPPELVRSLGPTIKVFVEKVLVVPQPFGSLRVYAKKCASTNKNMGSTLVIDPGYKTLDWVFSHGMEVDMARSGSFSGGVLSILRDISNNIGKQLGVGYVDLLEVEHALETGIIFANGRDYDFTPFKDMVNDVAQGIIDKFFSALKIDRQFSNILLTGGGGKYFREGLEKTFPTYSIQYEPDSVLNNARGFYLLASEEIF